MKIALLSFLVSTGLAAAAEGPLRVLYAGAADGPAARHCHVLMRELGRDAVWFEYTADPSSVPAEELAGFDVFLLAAPMPAVPAGKSVQADLSGDEKTWSSPDAVAAVKASLLQAAGPERAKSHAGFLAGREAERREANPNVANYEKRPQPLTFQHPFSVKGSMERTQVAPDLELKLFASEPDIGKPIAFAWDERGRLWVCETADYPHGVTPDGMGRDSIKICEDTDGDGRADKFTVFADRLNIPTSLVFANGGVIVAQPPRFLFLRDTNGDDKADERTEILTGWGIGDTHAQASNLHRGLDNWLYGCVGYSAFKGTVGGKELDFRMGTYRFKADGSALEFLHQFTNNSWAHSENAAGDQFGGTANGAPIFYGGIPATAWPAGLRGMSAKRINVEPMVHTITPNFRQVDVFGGYTAAAGSAFIESARLPARLQGKAMVCEPTMKVISLMDVRPVGAGYTALDGFNLVASSDEWMSPVFAEVGPDGAVWFADFQNFIIQHNPTPSVGRGGYDAKTGVGGAHENPLRDHSRGRVYRVTWKSAPPARAPNLAGANDATLAGALGHDTAVVRHNAQRLLVEGKRAGAAPLLKPLVAQAAGPGAAHALWTLAGLGELDEATHRAALLAKDSALRRNATRALPADAKGVALLFGSGVISDPDPVTRLAALVKLAAFETTPQVQTVVKRLAADPAIQADEWLAEAARLLGKRHQADLYVEGPNLLPNPSLEDLGPDGLPAGWKRRDYGGDARREANAKVEWATVEGGKHRHSGQRGLRAIGRGGEADTSFYADVEIKPNTRYRLSAWVKTHAFRGKASLNDHIGRAETEKVTLRESEWAEVTTEFDSGTRTRASINILYVGTGDATYDDVKLCELKPAESAEAQVVGDAARGSEIFWKHPTAACALCHMLGGKGSTVGPALDGLAARKDAAYIRESLLEPNKLLAPGYEKLGASPMPPMGLILNAREIADIQAFLGTLK